MEDNYMHIVTVWCRAMTTTVNVVDVQKKKKPSVLNSIFKKLTDQTNSVNNNIPSCSLNEPLSKDLLQVGLLLQVKHRL